MQKNLAQKLKDAGIIVWSKVTLRSGKKSDFYCNVKKMYGHPEILGDLADAVVEQLSGKTFTCIVASGYGGLPLASIVSLKINKPLTLIRETKKSSWQKCFGRRIYSKKVRYNCYA